MSALTLSRRPDHAAPGRSGTARRSREPVGRRQLWRRTQARRALAAALAALAVWAGLSAVAHTRGGGASVVVATSDLSTGRHLTAADLRRIEVDAQLVPTGAVTDPASVTGSTLAQSVGAGEILTTTRLRPARSLTGLPAGQRAVHLPVADPGSAALVRPGDRVDVVALDTGAIVGSDVLVLAVDTAEAQASGLTGGSGQRTSGVVVAVATSQLPRLVPAAARPSGDGIHLLLKPDLPVRAHAS